MPVNRAVGANIDITLAYAFLLARLEEGSFVHIVNHFCKSKGWCTIYAQPCLAT